MCRNIRCDVFFAFTGFMGCDLNGPENPAAAETFSGAHGSWPEALTLGEGDRMRASLQ